MAIASGTCGTCTWTISDAGELSIRPTSGNSGYLLSGLIATNWPWQDYAEEVRSAVFSGSIYFYREQWSGQQPIETGEAWNLFAISDGIFVSPERRYSNLTSITGFGSLKNLVDISIMFGSCTALTTLDLSSLDTTNVTKMTGMFYNCNLLSSVTFGNLFSTENVEKSEDPFFGKGTNTTNGIIVQNNSGFMKLTASQRAGTWERGVAPAYSAVAFRTAGGVPDTSGEDVEIDVTWATDASTTARTLKVYKKLSSTTSYPSTAEVTRTLSGNSGIESITLTNVGSEAYDFKVEFYDGTNTFIAFPAVIANKDLVTLDKSGNLWVAGSISDGNGNVLSGTLLAHNFTKTFTATASGVVNLGALNANAPAGYTIVSVMPVVPSGVDTSIFGNSPELLIYDGNLYVKTYKAASNAKLEIYCICSK